MECSCGAPDVTVPYCNVLGEDDPKGHAPRCPVGVRLADLTESLVAVCIERDAASATVDEVVELNRQRGDENAALLDERDRLREALEEAVYELDGRVDEGTALQVEHGRAVVKRLRAVLAENEEGTGGYRRARGSMPWIDSDEPAESSVRRLRGHE